MFKLKYANDRGSINLRIDQNLEPSELKTIWDFVSTSLIKEKSIVIERVEENLEEVIRNLPNNGSRQLGDRPAEIFHMGSYVEPDSGVILKMLHFPGNYVKATKIVREISQLKLPIKSCADIVAGNVVSPIFSNEMAEDIMRAFKENDIYAKTIPTTKSSRAA